MDKTKNLYFMELALEEARKAYIQNEVPVGALVVDQGKIIARAYNRVQKCHSGVAHAELLALENACFIERKKYFPTATLYVTLEPCPMCAAACYWTQIGRLVFSAKDPKRGYRQWSPSLLHPKTIVDEGLLSAETSALLKQFFKERRQK